MFTNLPKVYFLKHKYHQFITIALCSAQCFPTDDYEVLKSQSLTTPPPPPETYPVVGWDGVGPRVEVSDRVDLEGEVVQESVPGVKAGDVRPLVAPRHRRRRVCLHQTMSSL